ncbi:unconventional myosin-XVIIIa-like [Oncorhynchus mykiss]|uniref:unconventional myosin-XVIIIa-like n=1 Tax=Oncorhynchus mykiss TaxID=8022 RepID=UPI001877F7DB|nr:unconventional myosin-XVIIIa-like [Oncorhynchus mykiss]
MPVSLSVPIQVQQIAVRCFQSNIRTLRCVAKWIWWKLLCRVRPLLDVNMDDQRLRAREDEIMALRRRLKKSERERNELSQTTDIPETKAHLDQCKVTRGALEKQLEEEKQKV